MSTDSLAQNMDDQLGDQQEAYLKIGVLSMDIGTCSLTKWAKSIRVLGLFSRRKR
jgi:hypothetical protein